jgi:hypothetical protein
MDQLIAMRPFADIFTGLKYSPTRSMLNSLVLAKVFTQRVVDRHTQKYRRILADGSVNGSILVSIPDFTARQELRILGEKLCTLITGAPLDSKKIPQSIRGTLLRYMLADETCFRLRRKRPDLQIPMTIPSPADLVESIDRTISPSSSSPISVTIGQLKQFSVI